MAAWDGFLVFIGLLTALVILLSRVTQRALATSEADETGGLGEISTRSLYLNVLFSQALFGLLILGGFYWAEIPVSTLGLALPTGTLGGALGAGLVFGGFLFLVNEWSVGLLDRIGIEYSERLRELLAPDTTTGWILLLFVVLPTIAVFEELLFRGVLIGVVGSGTGLSPWLLAVGSSIIFALGHGVQGRGGVVVTGVLGFVLAVSYVLTQSLFFVIVAHYVVNASEFLLKER